MFKKLLDTISPDQTQKNPSYPLEVIANNTPLPEDVVLQVFTFFQDKRDLAHTKGVCKLFDRVAQNKQLQNSIPWPLRDYTRPLFNDIITLRGTNDMTKKVCNQNLLPFSNDELVYQSSATTLSIININSHEHVKCLKRANEIHLFLMISDKQQIIFSDKSNFYNWNPASGISTKLHPEIKGELISMALVSDTLLAYAVKLDRMTKIKIRNLTTGHEHCIFNDTDSIKKICAFSEDKIIVTLDSCNLTSILDINSGRRHSFNGINVFLKVSEDTFLLGSDKLALYDINYGLKRSFRPLYDYDSINCIVKTSDTIVIFASRIAIRILNIETGKCLAEIPTKGPNGFFKFDNDYYIRDLAVMPDGRVFFGLSDGQIQILPFAFKEQNLKCEKKQIQ